MDAVPKARPEYSEGHAHIYLLFRVLGFEFRVSGFGFGVWGFGFWLLGFGIRDLGYGFWDMGFGCGSGLLLKYVFIFLWKLFLLKSFIIFASVLIKEIFL